MVMKHKISIIIINKRDRGIVDTLTALSAINDPLPYEIIVIDGSAGSLNDIRDQFPKIRWIDFKSKTNKRTTIPEQRNVGVKSSKGALIAFIDANCVPSQDWLLQLTRPILQENESIVAGATFSKGGETLRDQTHIDNKNKHRRYINECPTINLAFKREVFNKVSGFDESFNYGSDVDFSWRVIQAGYRVRYEPKAIIVHDWGDKKQEVKRSFRYGRARAHLYIKHRHDNNHKIIRHPDLIAYPLYLITLPIAIIFPWYLLVLLIPLIKNYKRRPVQIVFEHFIFAAGIIFEILTKLQRVPS